jgi:hypothetical protein
MAPLDPVEFGRHSAQLEAMDNRLCKVETTVNTVNDKLDDVLMQLAEKRGERKAIATVATLAGGLGSLVITILYKWLEH